MNKKTSLISIATFMFIFAGCSIPTTFYTPKADNTYTTTTTEDVYNVMIDSERTYGLSSVPRLSIISTDNKEDIHHTILAYNPQDSTNFNTADMYKSALLTNENAELLNVEIVKAIGVWDDNLSMQEARDISFLNIGDDTYFSFKYQHTSRGPIVTIIMKRQRIIKPATVCHECQTEEVLPDVKRGFVSSFSMEFTDIEELQIMKLLIEKSLARN